MAKKKSDGLTAKTADRHALYQAAVQCPEAEMNFVDAQFKRLRGREAARIREDFCGTGYSSCEWVRRRKGNTSVGLDLDLATLQWGADHNVAALPEEAQRRVQLLRRDVREPGPGASSGFDAVLAMNFSYWIFKTRAALAGYFKVVRRSLKPDGLFFMDVWGGYESMKEQVEKRKVKGFQYQWEQAGYNPVTGDLTCHIHFAFPDGSKIHRAFTYEWRLWTVPEIREVLLEAGFGKVRFYGEGNDKGGGGNGVFRETKKHDADASFVAYMVAER